ncbi:MAG: Holliday junction resolvase RuvX [Candidatus Buchananbacteria bacterium]|nr:Holliday junction resolvase RuvX [Candidatus Buchananbacteria bacterium]
MNFLGIDYGAKKIGLAKSSGQLALPFDTLINQNDSQVLADLKKIIETQEIEKIVVGVPLSLSGNQGEPEIRSVDFANQQMQSVLNFIELLKNNFDLPIILEDERLSTKMAQRLQRDLTKKNGDDAVAAMLILQNYLDRKH